MINVVCPIRRLNGFLLPHLPVTGVNLPLDLNSNLYNWLIWGFSCFKNLPIVKNKDTTRSHVLGASQYYFEVYQTVTYLEHQALLKNYPERICAYLKVTPSFLRVTRNEIKNYSVVAFYRLCKL